MPTFFNKNELTSDQASRWDGAIIEYNRIQDENIDRKLSMLSARERAYYLSEGWVTDADIRKQLSIFANMVAAGAGHHKSALFFRLLQGHAALKFAPPCSFSYPWYSVIEDDGPWEVNQMADTSTLEAFRYVGISDEPQLELTRIGINQATWDVISQLSESEAIVSYGPWHQEGRTWRLVRDKINTLEAQLVIYSGHDKQISRISTYDQLVKEQRFQVVRRLAMLKIILNPDGASQHVSQAQAKSKWDGLCAQSEVDRATKLLHDRREQQLPDYPTELEIDNMAAEKVNDYFQRGYSVDNNGALFTSVWRLHRLT